MQSTINLAIKNACHQLQLPSAFADAVVAHIWRVTSSPPPHTSPHPPPPPPAPAPAAPTVANIEKLNRQQVQKLEELADEAGDTTDEKTLHKTFVSRINGLPVEAFKAKSLIDHMRDFLGLSEPAPSNAAAAPAAVPPEDDDEDLAEISWHLRTYDVGVKTNRVYELRNGVHVFVGMLGMNEFRGMVMPELE
jgi:hypothetical protein